MDIPETLYHYTSLSSLALILENRTIRFTRLDKLDDPQECRTAGSLRNVSKTRFASCWTDDAEESIPMWREYAGTDCGVRIELPSDPFKRYCWTVEEVERVTGATVVREKDAPNPFPATLVPFEKAWDGGTCFLEFGGGNMPPQEVAYTDDPELLFPVPMEQKEDGSLSFPTNKLGVCKAKAWSYQSEWRHFLTAAPFSFKDAADDPQKLAARSLEFYIDLRSHKELLEYCDLEISDEAFASMRVTASPALSAGNRLILQMLLEKHNPDAEFIESTLEL